MYSITEGFSPILYCRPDVVTLGNPFDPMRFLKKNQTTPRPSEHPPVVGGKCQNVLVGSKGCKYKTSSWHLNRFPDADNIGSTI